jgi:hypothetical protein
LLTLGRRECNECTQEEKFILEEEYLKISRGGKRLRTALGNGKAEIEGGEKECFSVDDNIVRKSKRL